MIRKISIALVVASLVLTSAGVSQARSNEGRGRGGHGGGHVAGRPAVQQPHPGFAARPGFQGHQGFVARPGFQGHHGFAGRQGFAPHRHFQRGGVVIGIAPFVIGGAIAGGALAYGAAPYYDPGYAYSAPAPSYWYYCPSAGAYYPDVPACPEPWVPVPSQ
jgi:hypothetical protein